VQSELQQKNNVKIKNKALLIGFLASMTPQDDATTNTPKIAIARVIASPLYSTLYSTYAYPPASNSATVAIILTSPRGSIIFQQTFIN
jgi:hypothetical protein